MEILNRFICKTQDLGIHGNLFGGTMLAKIDEASAQFAARIACSTRMVTLKMSEVRFRKPVKLGNNVTIKGEVLKIGNSSVTIKVEVYAYDPETINMEVVCTTDVVFVHIDEQGQSKRIDTVHENYQKYRGDL